MARARSGVVLQGTDGAIVRRSVLRNGLRIITEQVPGVRSVAFGVWVGAGSRDEPAAQMGSAHFLEHALFKGTKRRDALTISAEIEAVGGDLNAFTTKEYTCYHARVLDRDINLAVDVVCDLVTHALLSASDVEAERGVILEEIAMHEDEPSDLVHDVFARQMFGDTPLGRPILGTIETIASLRPQAIRRFYRERYVTSNIVIAAAGNLDHDHIVRLVRKAFAEVEPRTAPARALLAIAPEPASIRVVPRGTEQANVVLGVPGIRRGDDRRYAMAVLSTALGGGMSSRLFQEIREKRGLAYSVYTYAQGFADTGMFGLYAGCLPNKVETVLSVSRATLSDVADSGLTLVEFERARGQVRGATVLGQEDTGARMTRIAKSELHDEPLLDIPEVIDRIDGVGLDDVHHLAQTLFVTVPTVTVVGPFDGQTSFASVA